MIHLDSLLVSRELKGRTRTATFTEAPDILVACSAVKKSKAKGSGVFQVILLVGVFWGRAGVSAGRGQWGPPALLAAEEGGGAGEAAQRGAEEREEAGHLHHASLPPPRLGDPLPPPGRKREGRGREGGGEKRGGRKEKGRAGENERSDALPSAPLPH